MGCLIIPLNYLHIEVYNVYKVWMWLTYYQLFLQHQQPIYKSASFKQKYFLGSHLILFHKFPSITFFSILECGGASCNHIPPIIFQLAVRHPFLVLSGIFISITYLFIYSGLLTTFPVKPLLHYIFGPYVVYGQIIQNFLF